MFDIQADKTRLWHGAVFGGIVSGIMAASDESYGRTRFWEGTAYVCDGLDGREGTVFFEGSWKASQGWAVGLFFDPKSDISPFNNANYDLQYLTRGMPSPQRIVTEEAVRSRMFDEIHGKPVPLVTAAFWNVDDGRLVTSVPWVEAMENGLELLGKEFKGFNPESVSDWQADYEIPTSLVDVAVGLYHKRIASPNIAIELEESEAKTLREYAADVSLGPCQQYLSMMEIYIPH